MLDNLDYDDGEHPPIGLVPAGVSWADVLDHIKIGHGPLLVLPVDSDQYAGAIWADTVMIVTEDLGSDLEEAIGEFRDILRERGVH